MLDQLAEATRAVSTFVRPSEDIETKVAALYNKISNPVLTDLKLTCAFVAEVTATFKAVRHFVRANPVVRSQGCPYPEYTPEFERMVAMAERLRAQLGRGSVSRAIDSKQPSRRGRHSGAFATSVAKCWVR